MFCCATDSPVFQSVTCTSQSLSLAYHSMAKPSSLTVVCQSAAVFILLEGNIITPQTSRRLLLLSLPWTVAIRTNSVEMGSPVRLFTSVFAVFCTHRKQTPTQKLRFSASPVTPPGHSTPHACCVTVLTNYHGSRNGKQKSPPRTDTDANTHSHTHTCTHACIHIQN